MSSAAPLQNIYYERVRALQLEVVKLIRSQKTATAKPCYICKRPTLTVLATLKAEDFLYTCDGHLSDPGFASPIAPPAPSTPTPSADDIRKVVSDYEAKQARKAKEAKDGDKKDKDGGDTKEPVPDVKVDSPKAPPTPPAPTHRKFSLHRQIFEMRRNELKRRDQGSKAKEAAKVMPQVPRTAF